MFKKEMCREKDAEVEADSNPTPPTPSSAQAAFGD
jgi:hypothetical protein